tara:strand:- start:1102 stop:1251 length:150 start_codon:yes stop_codon:yes gene_type:complete
MLYEVHYNDISGWKYMYVKLTSVQAAAIAAKLNNDARCVDIVTKKEEYV